MSSINTSFTKTLLNPTLTTTTRHVTSSTSGLPTSLKISRCNKPRSSSYSKILTSVRYKQPSP